MEAIMGKSCVNTALAAFLAVSTLIASHAVSARKLDPDPRSLSLYSVELIGLDSNMCEFGISQEMYKAGYLVTDKVGVSDAILEIEVLTNGSALTPKQVEKAHYSAVLVTADDRVLFATGGNERARNLQALCEDIGDEIADQLKDKMTS
jgi:hypothetical protein